MSHLLGRKLICVFLQVLSCRLVLKLAVLGLTIGPDFRSSLRGSCETMGKNTMIQIMMADFRQERAKLQEDASHPVSVDDDLTKNNSQMQDLYDGSL